MSNQFTITYHPSLEKLAKKFGTLGLDKFLNKEVKKLALDIEGKAKKETPVDIGGLVNSIRTSVQAKGYIVRPHVQYARWIHEGKMVRNGRTIYLKGHGRAGTPRGGKPYMEIGAKRALVGFQNRLNSRLGKHISVKLKGI